MWREAFLANKYMLKVSNRASKKWSEIYSELTLKTIKTTKQCLTPFSSISIVDFEQETVC